MTYGDNNKGRILGVGNIVPLYDDGGGDNDVRSPRESFPISKKVVNINLLEGHSLQHNSLPKEWKAPKDLSIDNIIGDTEKGVST